jgi:3-dehydroquinate synthetase
MRGAKVHRIEFKDTSRHGYNVFVGRDLLQDISAYVAGNISKKRQAIITDGNVAKGGHLARLDPGGRIPRFIIEPDAAGSVETKKSILTYGAILDFLDSHGFEKNDILLCLGGGVIGDMGGFVAGTYKRGGMTYVQIPTTTLSQADSSVGGKCAVDSNVSKNAAGCIYQPHLVVSDVSTLLSQDERNFRSGLAESVKHGLILSEEYFSFLEQHMDGILGRDLGVLEEIALANVRLKGMVVGQDPDEKNYRRGLNFGHTVGHAIEFVSDFKLYHGESVALGMLAALDISEFLGGIDSSARRGAEVLLSRLGMPAKVPCSINRGVVEKKLSTDKKAVDGVPYFVRIDGIGTLHVEDGQYASPIPKEALMHSLDYIFNP